jgi:hypothetical protein
MTGSQDRRPKLTPANFMAARRITGAEHMDGETSPPPVGAALPPAPTGAMMQSAGEGVLASYEDGLNGVLNAIGVRPISITTAAPEIRDYVLAAAPFILAGVLWKRREIAIVGARAGVPGASALI